VAKLASRIRNLGFHVEIRPAAWHNARWAHASFWIVRAAANCAARSFSSSLRRLAVRKLPSRRHYTSQPVG